MNRRDYIQKFLLGGTVLVLAPSVLQSCSKDDESDPGTGPGTGPAPGRSITVDLSAPENAVLNTSGGSRIVQSVLVINTAGNFTALSSVCTHEGCTVGYNATADKIQCPCHGSEYNTAGSVLLGPAVAPLDKYTVTKTDNILTIAT